MSIRNPYSGRYVRVDTPIGRKVSEISENMPDFIKGWKVEELKERLKHVGHEDFTLEIIREDVFYAQMVYFINLLNLFSSEQIDELLSSMDKLSL